MKYGTTKKLWSFGTTAVCLTPVATTTACTVQEETTSNEELVQMVIEALKTDQDFLDAIQDEQLISTLDASGFDLDAFQEELVAALQDNETLLNEISSILATNGEDFIAELVEALKDDPDFLASVEGEKGATGDAGADGQDGKDAETLEWVDITSFYSTHNWSEDDIGKQIRIVATGENVFSNNKAIWVVGFLCGTVADIDISKKEDFEIWNELYVSGTYQSENWWFDVSNGEFVIYYYDYDDKTETWNTEEEKLVIEKVEIFDLPSNYE